ncbi:MAG: ATP phosphoribosyltransferase [Lachnospiraceae bacterium]|nr:ATP phosphoribosyltransferase [Lachnospiraceae bacterium]
MQKMDRKGGAIGFAVYLDVLERLDDAAAAKDDGYINIALPKGRLGNNVYDMFERAGYECPGIKEDNRKLVFENDKLKIRFFWVKPTDVPIYVERGAADIGVGGKDIVLENAPDVYELLDLKTGVCEICVAALKGFKDDTSRTLRVATKFTDIAREFYADKCRDIDIIKLNGSIELAPILGLSDVIVDIVETGTTLRENNLEAIEKVMPVSARLIANKASFEFKGKRIDEIKKALLKEMEERK